MSNSASKDEFNVFRDEFDNTKENSDSRKVTHSNPHSIVNNDKERDSKQTILIIDDELHVREALKLIFEKKYKVILCGHGETGIRSINPDIFAVILDIKMEGKNGFETLTEIKKKNIYLPVIFLTAYQDLKDPLEILNEYRPFGYVIKGSEGKELQDTVESAVSYYDQINKNIFLVKALQSKNLALQDLRENLELMVNKRTQELTNANKELQKEIQVRLNAEKEIKALLVEKEIILKEVHHRIKNNMTTLKSILSLHAGMLEERAAQEALFEAESRIHSMMVLYDKLYQSVSFSEMSIKEYIQPLVEQIINNFPNHESVSLKINVQDFILDTKRLQPIGIIINELLTNIMKYAFLDRLDGEILIEVGLRSNSETKNSIDTKTFFIVIHDNGNGLSDSVDFQNSSGFGLRLIELLAQQLNGTIHIEQKNGVRFLLEFKI